MPTSPRRRQGGDTFSIDLLTDRLDQVALDFDMDRLQFIVLAARLLPEAFHHALPNSPTSCQPGSPEKKEIMRLRVKRGESPFHPKDCGEPLPAGEFGRAGKESPCAKRKRSGYSAIVNRIRGGSFRTAQDASAAAAAARAAAKRAIQEAQDAAR